MPAMEKPLLPRRDTTSSLPDREASSPRRRSGRHEAQLKAEEILGNIEENKHWILHSTVVLRQRSNFRPEVTKAFQVLTQEAQAKAGAGHKFDLEDVTIGPALPYAFRANYVIWGFFTALTFFGDHLVHVDPIHGLATIPQGLGLAGGITCLIIYATWSLYYEKSAAFYVLPTQGCAVDREEVGHEDASDDQENICRGIFKFDTWMGVMLSLSFVLHVDIYTSSIFFARVRKSVKECDALESHWQSVLLQSPMLQRIAGNTSFLGICYFAWFGMLCQFLFALMYAWPMSPNLRDLVGDEKINTDRVKYEMLDSREKIVRYHTVMKAHQTHGRALQALADSGRMNCLNWQDDYYLEEAEKQWDIRAVAKEMGRVNVRFFLFALQAALLPNLQVTFLGMQTVAEAQQGRRAADWLTTSSITVSVLSGLHYILYEYGCVQRHYAYVKRALRKAMKEAEEKRSNELAWDAKEYGDGADFRWWLNRTLCIFFFFFFLQLLLKTFMAMTVCESGTWNAKFFNPSGHFDWKAGCVPLKNFTNVTCNAAP